MELVHEFSYQAQLDAPLDAGPGPLGARMIVPVTGGTATGDRISGTLVGGGADWILVGADGFGRLDVRAQIHTDDGAVLYLRYDGLLEMNGAVQQAIGTGGGTAFDDQYFRSRPIIETGDPRYAWVNTTVFVGRGRIIPGGVEYEVYRVS